MHRGHGEAGAGGYAAGLAHQRRDQRVLHRHAEPHCSSRSRTWSTTGGSASARRCRWSSTCRPSRITTRSRTNTGSSRTILCRTTGRARMVNVLVTGGAGFIGSNFVRYALSRHADWHVTTLDKLTYAGRRENLHDVMNHPRHTFVHGDIADAAVSGPLVEQSEIVVHFAAETHVDRSILAAGEFIRTDVAGHVRAARGGAARRPAPPLRADLDRRSVRQRAGGREQGDRRTAAAQPIFGEQGRRGSPRLQLLGDLRAAGRRHAGVEQLRAVPVSREGDPALRDQRDRRHPRAALRGRQEHPRLAARRGSLPRHRSADRPRRQAARSTTSAAATRS